LVERGVAHVRDGHRLELLDREPAREVRQQAVERRPAKRAERAVLERHVHVEMVPDELEVHDAGGLLRRALLRPALDVQADEQPADDADCCAERADEELLEVHPVAVSSWFSILRQGRLAKTAARPQCPMAVGGWADGGGPATIHPATTPLAQPTC